MDYGIDTISDRSFNSKEVNQFSNCRRFLKEFFVYFFSVWFKIDLFSRENKKYSFYLLCVIRKNRTFRESYE